MLQVYSNNLNLELNENSVLFVPFNNVSKDKGNDSFLSAPGTIQINRQGVYMDEVNISLAPTVAGDYIVQLYVNGVSQPETITRFTAVAGAYSNVGFSDLVTVQKNNTCCCYTSPTLLQVGISSATGAASAIDIANVNSTLTRLC